MFLAVLWIIGIELDRFSLSQVANIRSCW